MIEVWTAKPRARMTAWYDASLGKVSMTRLVVYALGVIVFSAFLLSWQGTLSFTLAQLAATLAVTVVTSVAVTWICAFMTRSRPQPDSAIITGMLLFFLFWPSTSSVDLRWYAAAAAIAAVSKYLLVWRGRHLFNPAALGAFAVGVLGVTSSVWWVASKPLLVVVIITGVVVVRRAGHALAAMTFIVVSTSIMVWRLTDSGQGFPAAVQTVVVSYPFIFAALFMLTEPLTLPPRRSQQLAVATVVGILAALPYEFHLGSLVLSTTPEAALVAGNLVAALLGARAIGALTLVQRRVLASNVVELTWKPQRPVSFRTGQYLELHLPHAGADARGLRRSFSLTSAPTSDLLTMATRIPAQSSTFKRALHHMTVGATARATRIAGDFVLPKNPNVPLLFVAGGIGITPFLSHLAGIVAAGEHRDVVMIYSVSHPDDIFGTEVLVKSGARVVVLAPEEPKNLPEGWQYAGSGRINPEVIALAVRDASRRKAYLSGPPAMVNDVRWALRNSGVRRVRTDVFFGA